MNKPSRGASLVELLIVLPIVLWLGLGALQVALVMHARTSIAYAASEAARSGSLEHADPSALQAGLARGLLPWLHPAQDAAGYALAVAQSKLHVTAGTHLGWIEIRQRSPTPESFDDWAQPALDAGGHPISGRMEIPNDSLPTRMRTQWPSSGVSGWRGEEPIGAASGQTLLDANLLKIEVVYGVPLRVPFVGALAGWIMRQVDGCAVSESRRLGTWSIAGRSALALLDARPWVCRYYSSIDLDGRPVVRWPVQVSALVRMQSAAWHTGLPRPQGATPAGVSSGLGRVDQIGPNVTTGSSANVAPGDPPHLQFGGHREPFGVGGTR